MRENYFIYYQAHIIIVLYFFLHYRFFEELKKMQQLLSCKPIIKPVLKYDSAKNSKSTVANEEKAEEVDFECFTSLFDK